MGAVTVETHEHRRPGGAVFDAACTCPDPGAWPVPAEAGGQTQEDVAVLRDVLQAALSRAGSEEPGPGEAAPAPLPSRETGLSQAMHRALQRAARSGRSARPQVTRVIALAHRGIRGAVRTARGLVARWVRGVARGSMAVLKVIAAVIVGLGNGAQVAGVGVATWAAWELEPVAGKMVLAAGLLFLGGAVGRVVREVRNGSR